MKIERPKPDQIPPENSKVVHNGIVFDVIQWDQNMYDGSIRVFETIRRSDTVVVLPVTDDGKIIIIEEEQPGEEKFIGAIGGRMEYGEDVIEAIKREMQEESGYTAERFQLWNAVQMARSPKIDWVMYTFIAKGIKKVSDINLDGGEKIKLLEVTFDELIKLTYDGKFVEKQIESEVLHAMLDNNKMEELKKLFDPKY